MAYKILLKLTKFGVDQLNCSWDIQQKPSGRGGGKGEGVTALGQNRVNFLML